MRNRIAASFAFALLAAASASADPHHPGRDREGLFFERFIPTQGRLGVQLQDMTPELREFMRAPEDRGVLVVRVTEDSAAEKAGVRVGDVIVAIGGEPVRATRDVIRQVMGAEKDSELALEVVREGKPAKLAATLSGEPLVPPRAMGWMERDLPELRERLEQRMGELERRLEELEQRLKAGAADDELDT
ncbi:MAG: PDZ domain-containing protein [Deltaproteobacteria bacterium]|nr:PDZ domain-containing protein [Deltaproteobacteria bacterium]